MALRDEVNVDHWPWNKRILYYLLLLISLYLIHFLGGLVLVLRSGMWLKGSFVMGSIYMAGPAIIVVHAFSCFKYVKTSIGYRILIIAGMVTTNVLIVKGLDFAGVFPGSKDTDLHFYVTIFTINILAPILWEVFYRLVGSTHRPE